MSTSAVLVVSRGGNSLEYRLVRVSPLRGVLASF